jgi:hypothetical protein
MNKLFWLTSIAGLCCFGAIGQQQGDSAFNQHLIFAGSDSSFTNFEYAVKDGNKIILQWSAGIIEENEFFIIERSSDGNNYETIGALKGGSNGNQYEIADNSLLMNLGFYRIKYIAKSGQPVYSKSLQVSLSKNSAVKFYPNPVDKLLIIETDHKADIQLINAFGTVKLNAQLQPGLQIINVGALERGTYILRIVDKEGNRDVLQQLVKN